MDHILICAQRLNEETLSIVIPYVLLSGEEKDKWVKICSHKQTVNGIDNVVVIDSITVTKNKHTYHEVNSKDKEIDELTKIFLQPVLRYGSCRYSKKQEPWKTHCYKGLVSDYDDIPNYQTLLNDYKSKIKGNKLLESSWSDAILSENNQPNPVTDCDEWAVSNNVSTLFSNDVVTGDSLNVTSSVTTDFDITDIKICDSLLILQSIDGVLITQKYKTVQEKMEDHKIQKRSYNRYYLFCAQDANFQTRSLLIPEVLLPKHRKQQWSNIKTYCKDNSEVKNLVVINIVWQDNCGKIDPKDKELYGLCSIFENVADGDRYHGDDDDRDWQHYSYVHLCCGFNHVKNYQQLLQMTSYDEHDIEIVDSILVLNSDEGNIYTPTSDTVEEMMYEMCVKDVIDQ